jgi:7,8-dihydropterin-6-yl-methyl-4-(beta-D-ribofuranosyl)aminobenzene 5'-phosphate synthase
MIPDEILDIQARLCQAMGRITRLKIAHSLREGAMNVSDLAGLTGCTQGAVSRHLTILRNAGIVTAERRGTGLYYRIANPKILTVCDLMGEVLAEQISQRSKIFKNHDTNEYGKVLMTKHSLILLSELVLLLCACTGFASPTASPDLPAATVTVAASSTPSLTPFPPATLLPTLARTRTSFPTSTEEPMPTEALSTPLTITIVYNNIPGDPRLTTDWGSGAYIEYHGRVVLFDTGTNGQILLQNMKTLALDPAGVQYVVLSHAHQDHTRGLSAVLAVSARPPVYLLAAFGDPFIEQTRRVTEVVEATPGLEITANILTTGEVPGGIPEQALVIRTGRGLVVVTGCAHPGIVRMVERAMELTGEPVYLVMGGFHLRDASQAEIKAILADFRRIGVQKVAPSHCTGERAIAMFAAEYGENFLPGGVGSVISVEE